MIFYNNWPLGASDHRRKWNELNWGHFFWRNTMICPHCAAPLNLVLVASRSPKKVDIDLLALSNQDVPGYVDDFLRSLPQGYVLTCRELSQRFRSKFPNGAHAKVYLDSLAVRGLVQPITIDRLNGRPPTGKYRILPGSQV